MMSDAVENSENLFVFIPMMIILWGLAIFISGLAIGIGTSLIIEALERIKWHRRNQ